MQLRDLIAVLGLFLLALITRLAFTGQILYHWDSINFAFSLQQFDVAAGQPHVPGYILYVFLGRLVNLLFSDAQTTFVAISILGSSLAVVFLYLLGRDMFDRKVGLAAAMFLASSPLFWFYGEVALPHTLDTFAVVLSVWLFYRLVQGGGWFASAPAVIVTAAWLGIAGGLRPQTQVFLIPLALYAAWTIGWRRSLLAMAVLVAFDLIWFIPLVVLNGGLSRYLLILGQFSESFNATTSVFSGGGLFGLIRNIRKLVMYTAYGWGFAILPVGLAVLALLTRLPLYSRRSATSSENRLAAGLNRLMRDVRLWVLVLWLAPTLAYYTFVHMGQQGLVFVYLPALMLLSAAGLVYLAENQSLIRLDAVLQRRLAAGVFAFVLLVNSAIFLVVPTYPLGSGIKLLTRDTLSSHDISHQAILNGIQQNFPQDSTLILASWWRFPQYYLPEYALLNFDVGARWELDEGEGSIADETLDKVAVLGLKPDENGYLSIDLSRLGLMPDESGSLYLVLMDTILTEYTLSQDRLEWVSLPDGDRLAFIRLSPQEYFYFGSEAFDIIPALAEAPDR